MTIKRKIEILFKNRKFDFKRFNQVLKNYLRVKKAFQLKAFNKDLVYQIYGWSCITTQKAVKRIALTMLDNQAQ
jgi:hypothetical protein